MKLSYSFWKWYSLHFESVILYILKVLFVTFWKCCSLPFESVVRYILKSLLIRLMIYFVGAYNFLLRPASSWDIQGRNHEICSGVGWGLSKENVFQGIYNGGETFGRFLVNPLRNSGNKTWDNVHDVHYYINNNVRMWKKFAPFLIILWSADYRHLCL